MTRQTFPDNLIFANSAPELDAPDISVYAYAYESGSGKTPPKAGVHNAVLNRSDLQHQHVERNGIPIFDPRTPYNQFGLTIGAGGVVYQSKVANNLNNYPSTSPNHWLLLLSATGNENTENALKDLEAKVNKNTNDTKRNTDDIQNLKNQITIINDKIDTSFVDHMKLLFPIKSTVMRSVDPGLPVASGGLGFGVWQDKAGRVPIGAGTYTDGNSKTKTFGENGSGGTYEHTLTNPEMPTHDHVFGGTGALGTPGSGIAYSSWDGSLALMDRITETGNAGGSQPHNNIQPWFGTKIWYRVA